jgi:hypothetical protein
LVRGHDDRVKLLLASLVVLLVTPIVANGCSPKSCTTDVDCGSGNSCMYKISASGSLADPHHPRDEIAEGPQATASQVRRALCAGA